ncbi:MAG: branched-chain amino acid transaminase [Dehalococcoidia bacterium]|jgi:branched-chain amino acid aminotransferase|nr:MAG: branched-chain amino acid transaminase [Dehalococcoidia bacterium]
MPQYAYFKGEFIPLADAKLGVMTHALHYGTACFEGIRGNWNAAKKQMFIFRPSEHYQRLLNSCKVLKIELPYTVEKLVEITVELARRCEFKEDIYIRPLAYKSAEALGVRLHGLEADFLAFVIPWGPYLDVDKARCAIASWRRPDDNTIPPQAKLTGLYINNALAKTEAIEHGYDEAIMLTAQGYVSEGSGENIFIITNGKLVTPSVASSILVGITRDTVIKLAKEELGLETEEKHISRNELYTARECFLTGTAAHITPVAEIDGRKIADGEIGEVTARLQKLYFEIIKGNVVKHRDWCVPVYPEAG